jgi:hypothetical protein
MIQKEEMYHHRRRRVGIVELDRTIADQAAGMGTGIRRKRIG